MSISYDNLSVSETIMSKIRLDVSMKEKQMEITMMKIKVNDYSNNNFLFQRSTLIRGVVVVVVVYNFIFSQILRKK